MSGRSKSSRLMAATSRVAVRTSSPPRAATLVRPRARDETLPRLPAPDRPPARITPLNAPTAPDLSPPAGPVGPTGGYPSTAGSGRTSPGVSAASTLAAASAGGVDALDEGEVFRL